MESCAGWGAISEDIDVGCFGERMKLGFGGRPRAASGACS